MLPGRIAKSTALDKEIYLLILAANAFISFTSLGHAKRQPHIEIMLCILHRVWLVPTNEAATPPPTQAPRRLSLSCWTCPYRAQTGMSPGSHFRQLQRPPAIEHAGTRSHYIWQCKCHPILLSKVLWETMRIDLAVANSRHFYRLVISY